MAHRTRAAAGREDMGDLLAQRGRAEEDDAMTAAGRPAAKPQWVLDLEAKHGLPIDQIPGMVYALHYDPPRIVKSVSVDYAGRRQQSDSSGLLSGRPIRHYVGWTQQQNPRKRIGRHAPMTATDIVNLAPGTMRDESELKLTGSCPRCGEAYRDSLDGPG